jgi:hypothetical protein
MKSSRTSAVQLNLQPVYTPGDVIRNLAALQLAPGVESEMKKDAIKLIWELLTLQGARAGDDLNTILFDPLSVGSWVKSGIQQSLLTLHSYSRQIHPDDHHASALRRLVFLLTICGYDFPQHGSLHKLLGDPEFSDYMAEYMALSSNRRSYMNMFSKGSLLSGIQAGPSPTFVVSGDDCNIGHTALVFFRYALYGLKKTRTTFPESLDLLMSALGVQMENNGMFDVLEFIGILLMNIVGVLLNIFKMPWVRLNDDLTATVCALTYEYYTQRLKHGYSVPKFAIDGRAYMIRKIDEASPAKLPYAYSTYAAMTVFYVFLGACINDAFDSICYSDYPVDNALDFYI